MAGPFKLVNNGENIAGKHRRSFFDLTGPASYANGVGIRVDTEPVGMKQLIAVDVVGGNAASLVWALRAVTPTTLGGAIFLRAYVQATGAEVANAVNLSGAVYRIEAIGY